MKSRIIVLAAIIFVNLYISNAQTNVVLNPFSGDYFRSPVEFPFKLSGNFCELRETHFHAGIDIKPSGNNKDKLYSIGDGYISRIRVSARGYGKAIYIDHPEVGYTSVYGHLDAFSEIIDSVARSYQLNQESFEIDYLLSPEILPIKKGEFIGYMGNSGHSFGKHLHFEIRETKSEKPINPFLFGITPQDDISPSLLSLSVHGLTPELYKLSENKVKLGAAVNNHIHISTPIVVPAWRAGIALQMYDKTKGSHNKQGIYGLHLYVDDSLVYSYHLNKLTFEQGRNVIGFYDYEVRKKQGSTFALCYKYPGNDLEFLNHTGTGVIPLYAARERKIRIEVEDFKKNKKVLTFSLLRSENMIAQSSPDSNSIKIFVRDSISINDKNLTLHFRPESLFRNLNLKIKKEEVKGVETKYAIHQSYEPIKTPIPITLKPEYPIQDKMNKAIIVRTNGNGRKVNYGGTWLDDMISTKMVEFGTFFIDYDTIAPSIKSINFSPVAAKKSRFMFYVRDNFGTKGKTVEEIKIKVWIDDIFVISPYAAKSSILEIPIKQLSDGFHNLRIEVQDHSHNFSHFMAGFVVKK